MVAYPGLVLGASVPLLRCDQKGAGKRECVLLEPSLARFNTVKRVCEGVCVYKGSMRAVCVFEMGFSV